MVIIAKTKYKDIEKYTLCSILEFDNNKYLIQVIEKDSETNEFVYGDLIKYVSAEDIKMFFTVV